MRQTSCRSSFEAWGSRLRRTILACLLPTLLPIAFGQIALTTAQIAKLVSPTVVVVKGKTTSGDVLGSGFIVSKDGKIVTNLHVIRDMKTATVQMAHGEMFDSVSVLATDERRDLAIIMVAGSNLPTLELGKSDTLTVGESVVVVGSPLGLEATVTAGILSAIRNDSDGFTLLQTDAAVNHGNSGGPLVNSKGQAVGVVSSIVRSNSAQGLNFAIPVNYVRGLLHNLHEPMTLEQMERTLRTTTSQGQQNGPPLVETLDWLKDKISTWGRTGWQDSLGADFDESIPEKFDSCNVTLTEHYENNTLKWTLKSTVPLGSIIDSQIKHVKSPIAGVFVSGSEWHYELSLIAQLKEISTLLTTVVGSKELPSPPSALLTNSVRILFDDETAAKRVQDAFRHASDLCRKKEPF